TTVTVAAGVATFSNLSINLAGTGYTLGATSGSLTPATSTNFSVSEANVFRSTDTPLTFGFGPLHSFLNVPQSLTIASVKVQVNIVYSLSAYIISRLPSPAAPAVTLSYFLGTGGNFQDTIFDDSAATPISAGDSPFAGSYRPYAPLAQVAGQNAQGVWQL